MSLFSKLVKILKKQVLKKSVLQSFYRQKKKSVMRISFSDFVFILFFFHFWLCNFKYSENVRPNGNMFFIQS